MGTILLLIGSNIFMTFAWNGHLKLQEVPLWKTICFMFTGLEGRLSRKGI
jgi:uncharacterized protein (DUF486 family)